jgi:hypothetical protein
MRKKGGQGVGVPMNGVDSVHTTPTAPLLSERIDERSGEHGENRYNKVAGPSGDIELTNIQPGIGLQTPTHTLDLKIHTERPSGAASIVAAGTPTDRQIMPNQMGMRRTSLRERLTSLRENQSMHEQFAKNFLFRHSFFLLLAVIACAFTEDHLLTYYSAYVNLWYIIFEIISAYGNVGLSLGYPDVNYSLSGTMSVLGKLVIISVMLLGKHRGLPASDDEVIDFKVENLRKCVDDILAIHEYNLTRNVYGNNARLVIKRRSGGLNKSVNVECDDDDDDDNNDDADADDDDDGDDDDVETKDSSALLDSPSRSDDVRKYMV